MIDDHQPSIPEQARSRLREIAEKEQLLDSTVSVLAKTLTPEEAIGTPGRRDFPIIIGKERMLEARFFEAKGHAFTDTFDLIWRTTHTLGKGYLVYGVTAAGVCALSGINRICPCGRDG